MTQYDNTNSGVLFKNDKEGNEKRPDYTGTINVDGKELALSAWLREGKKGKFLSLKVSEKRKAADIMPKSAPVADDDFDDAIPF